MVLEVDEAGGAKGVEDCVGSFGALGGGADEELGKVNELKRGVSDTTCFSLRFGK